MTIHDVPTWRGPDLRAWRGRHGFKQRQAGAAIGRAGETISKYEREALTIPRDVVLACIGYDTIADREQAEQLAEWTARAQALMDEAPSALRGAVEG